MTFRLNEDRYSCWEDAEPLPTSWWFFDGDSEMINPLHGLSWTLGTKKWEKIYQGLNIQEYQGINHLLRIYLWDIPYMFFQSASGCLDLKMRLRLDMRCMRNWPSHKDFPARCLGPSRSLGEGRGDFFFSNPWSGGVKLAKQRHGQCIWNYRVLFI